MAIKKLQNNYTTPEQSKRLLEIGVPADSADCYYDSWKQIQWRQLADLHNDFFDVYDHYIPCWSVGRLIEIIAACYLSTVEVNFQHRENMCDALVGFIKASVKYGEIDFSKLEE